MKRKTKTRLISLLIVVLATVAGLGIWYINWRRASVGSGNVLGIAWYDEDGTEFTISTADELYELAKLSKHYDFKDQTIKLGADIVVNEGNAEDWEFDIPDRLWDPIDGFAGTFDGQGHTISGICGRGDQYTVTAMSEIVTLPTGLFSNTQAKCVIKDFKLLNSFFFSDLNEGVGSISSNGAGNFERIYTDAIIVSYKLNNGGIIGLLNGKGSSTITNCWFDGEIRIEGNYGRFNGGIVGRVIGTGGQNKIEHCLSTGKLSSTVTKKGINMGGIVGNIDESGRIAITDCLAVGDLTNDYGVSVGTVIGAIGTEGSATVTNTYGREESFKEIVGATLGTAIGNPIAFREAMLTGYEAYRWTELDFDNYWAIVEDGTPILSYFAEEDPAIKGVEKAYDISWYDKTKKEFTISTLKELYGFAILSNSFDFAGKTVKLGADIIVNEGNADDWAENAPDGVWIKIGMKDFPFAGTFDGDMHTISGIYYKTNGAQGGIFAATAIEATVKNLKVTNSYFESTAQSLGSIVGAGRGKFETIYSNAKLVSYGGNTGGLMGQAVSGGGVIMTNCWFDGTVIAKGNTTSNRRAAGLIGQVMEDTDINNCLNTGTIDATAYTVKHSEKNPIVVPCVGGLVGSALKDKNLKIVDCLNAGEVKYSDAATTGYGSIIGYSDATTSFSGTYATIESCAVATAGLIKGEVLLISSDMLKGTNGYKWTHLDFNTYWAAVKNTTPVLKSFTNEALSVAGVKRMVDVSWYNVDKKVYVLDSVEDLYGFYVMSYATTFEGKTVKLGKDIVVNSGNAANWATSAPAYPWTPIGTRKFPFAGTFDGQGHTISGLYRTTTERWNGLFSVTDSKSVIKNLKLTNSYFTSTAADCGSIAGTGQGTFDTIYSNAIVVAASARVGGLIGQGNGDNVVMKNCWFDGTMTNTANDRGARGTGGLIGVMYSGKLTMSNCLNTGTVDVTAYTYNQRTNGTLIFPVAGGLIGQVSKDAKVNMSDCLNTGDVVANSVANGGFASVIGYIEGETNITETWATKESSKDTHSGTIKKGGIVQVDEDKIKGYGGYQWTVLDFDKYWVAVNNGTPVLKSFANGMSLAGVIRLVDTSWYDESKDTYVLTDMQDLHGFSILSVETDFAGKTIKLGADIVVNADINNPSYEWTSIGSASKPFAGTFDGAMHSISGIYLNATVQNSGLFAATSGKSVIKNLELTNSYFKGTGHGLGSLVGYGKGTIDTVKSDATVVGALWGTGGLIGKTDSKLTMKNCWFAGTVTNTGNTSNSQGTGGLIGCVFVNGDNKGNVSIDNCLNTGTIDVSTYTTQSGKLSLVSPYAGGLIGVNKSGTTAKLEYSLNNGRFVLNDQINYAVGPVVGMDDGTMTCHYAYATEESFGLSNLNYYIETGRIESVKEADIVGYKGYQWTQKLDFDKYWAVVVSPKEETPILKSFADSVPSLAGYDRMIDTSWYKEATGSENDPYVISDKEDLYGLASLSRETDFAGKMIKLDADITVNADINTPSYDWTPIGSAKKPFAGTFDGDMHSIRGIYIDESEQNTGLFAATSNEAVIKNLELTNSYFEGTGHGLGSLVGYGKGTIETVKSDATVVGALWGTGGLVGKTDSELTMKNCWFAGTVTNTGNTTNSQGTGGLIGCVFVNGDDKGNVSIDNCLNTGTINVSTYTTESGRFSLVSPYAGGLIGVNKSGATAKVEYSMNAGKFVLNDKTNYAVGPVVGMDDGTMICSYTYATEESFGLSNLNYYIENGRIESVKAADITGYKGYQWTQLDFDKYWAVVVNPKEGTPILKSFADSVPSLDGYDKMIDTSWYEEATGSENDPYVISDKADLYGLAALSSETDFDGKTIKLSKNIVINTGDAMDWAKKAPSYVWTPIGSADKPFAGTFDGDMHSISGLYLNTSAENIGLFAAIDKEAMIKNLKVTNSYFQTSNVSAGSVVGNIKIGKLDTVYSDAIVVSSSKWVGGLVGSVDGSTAQVTNCWFAGTVKNTSNDKNLRGTGGLVGYAGNATTLTMSNCLNSGIVDISAYTMQHSATNTNIIPLTGGIIGHINNTTNVTVNSSLNVGKILHHATTGYGPIVGYSDLRTDTVCDNTYATKESCGAAYTFDKSHIWSSEAPTMVNEADILGEDAKVMSGLDCENVWAIIAQGTPVLKSFESEAVVLMVDTSWYDETTGSETDPYIIADRADLYGLAKLSKETDFAGKTIKLTKDITINEGNVENWADFAPDFEWTMIGSNSKPFAGTFDGGMHTISGVYRINQGWREGFFGVTTSSAVIKNFKLVNSYFEAPGSCTTSVGSIVGRANGGTFDTIYSNAIVVSAVSETGGLIGYTNGAVSMNNCWFDGKVTNTTTDKAKTGGLIGEANKPLTLTNCLNSGTVDASAYITASGRFNLVSPYVGGLVGHTTSSATTVTIQYCLNIGEVKYSDTANFAVGPIVGTDDGTSTTCTDTYATKESCLLSTKAYIETDKLVKVDESAIKGNSDTIKTETLSGLFKEANVGYWSLGEKENSFPYLKSFKDVK